MRAVIGRVVDGFVFITQQKTACRAFEETCRVAMHKPGEIHRLGEFGPVLQSGGYESFAGTSVVLDVAFGEFNRKSIEAAEWTRWPN